MGQIPIIKGGIVVNVVELEDGTTPVLKAIHRARLAEEDADYQRRFTEWRKTVTDRQTQIADAKQKAFMASGIGNALRSKLAEDAALPPRKRPVANMDAPIAAADADVKLWLSQVDSLMSAPLLPKPAPKRGKRWVYPDDCIVGPPGGNVGDTWNGKKYSTPPKEKA